MLFENEKDRVALTLATYPAYLICPRQIFEYVFTPTETIFATLFFIFRAYDQRAKNISLLLC